MKPNQCGKEDKYPRFLKFDRIGCCRIDKVKRKYFISYPDLETFKILPKEFNKYCEKYKYTELAHEEVVFMDEDFKMLLNFKVNSQIIRTI